jgi:hypothetical protein
MLSMLLALARIPATLLVLYRFHRGRSPSQELLDSIVARVLADLVSTRHVGPFIVRLVRGELRSWRILETDSRNQRVIILTYDSEERAREDAARYASDASEVDRGGRVPARTGGGPARAGYRFARVRPLLRSPIRTPHPRMTPPYGSACSI